MVLQRKKKKKKKKDVDSFALANMLTKNGSPIPQIWIVQVCVVTCVICAESYCLLIMWIMSL